MAVKGWAPKPSVYLPGKTGTRVNLKTKDYDDLVDKQGVRVKVYRSSYCPNVKSIDGSEHEINCPICNGSQMLDRYCIETMAYIQAQNMEKFIQAEGMIDGNQVLATFLQGVELQYFTLVELVDFSEIFFERIKRQQGSLDVLKYAGLRVNMLVDKRGIEYFEGSDFKLDPNGSIIWCENKGPQAGTIYSINYETKVRFRAVRAGHSNRFAQVSEAGKTKMVKMNEQWMMQKDYLVERKDVDGKLIKPNRIRDDDDELAPGEREGDWGVDKL